MNKETFKTLFIILLCVLGLFLLRNLWLEDLVFRVKEEKVSSYVKHTDHLLSIKAINISLGGGRLFTIYNDMDKTLDAFKNDINLSLSNIVEVKGTSESLYYQKRLNKSIEFSLIAPLSQSHILSILNFKDVETDQLKGKIKSVLIVARETKKLWLNTDEGYFEVSLALEIGDASNHIDLKSVDSSLVPFQTVSQRFGLPAYRIVENEELFNQVLIPKFSLPVVLPIRIESEIDLTDIDALRNLARNVFGNRLDFVQEATDINGSTIFLYGYGDKALRVSQDGVVEYSERVINQLRNSASLIESLSSALLILEKLGGPIDELYLSDVSKISNENNTGFRFTFGYRLNSYPVLSLDKLNGASVEVYGGKVKTAYRNVLQYNSFKSLTNEQTVKFETDDAQFFNMISQTDNFNVIEADFLEDNPSLAPELTSIEKGQLVLNSINDVYVGFYMDENERLNPGVVLQFGNRRYCIDFYTYKLIKKD